MGWEETFASLVAAIAAEDEFTIVEGSPTYKFLSHVTQHLYTAPPPAAGEVYVDRGSPSSADFDNDDLTRDGTWYDLDLSSIVPAGAAGKLVHIRVWLRHSNVNYLFKLRAKGAGDYNVAQYHSIFNIYAYMDAWVVLDSARKVEYFSTGPNSWNVLELTVAGWMIDA